MRTILLALLLVPLACLRAAAPVQVELKPGLRYLGIQDLDTELAPATELCAASAAFILDLRNARGHLAASNRLAEALSAPVADTRVFRAVLVNADTTPTFTALLPIEGPGVVVLSPAANALRIDVPVDVDPVADRSAVAALRAGTAPLLLLETAPVKARNDEAALATTTPSPEPASQVTPAPASSTDHLLTRAVHLHAAWLATRDAR